MPKELNIRIQKDGNEESPEIHVEFSDKEWELLQRYSRYFDELADTDLGRRGFSFKFSFRWTLEDGWEPVETSGFPPKKDLREFLYMFRPIILECEATHFMKVLKVVSKRVPYRQGWRMLRDQFDGTRFRNEVTISVTPAPTASRPDRAGIVLNAEERFKKWLNAFEYHRDADKAAEFDEIQADDFPTPAHIKGLMLTMLRDKAGAAEKLRSVIKVMEGDRGSSFVVT
jgi:hypothetical protein